MAIEVEKDDKYDGIKGKGINIAQSYFRNFIPKRYSKKRRQTVHE